MLATSFNLELKAIKIAKFASEETCCFEAQLYLNGKKVARVSNDGQGGCDRVHWFDRDAERIIEDHFKALPPETTDLVKDGEPFTVQPDLEGWCIEQVGNHEILQDVKRHLRKKVLGITPGQKGELHFKLSPANLTPTARAAIEAKYPGIIILNGLTDGEILKAVKEASRD